MSAGACAHVLSCSCGALALTALVQADAMVAKVFPNETYRRYMERVRVAGTDDYQYAGLEEALSRVVDEMNSALRTMQSCISSSDSSRPQQRVRMTACWDSHKAQT